MNPSGGISPPPKKFSSKHLEEYEMQAKRYKEILLNTKAGSRNLSTVHPTQVNTNINSNVNVTEKDVMNVS